MKTNFEYDVIIIGAGPGGLTAARFLASNGKKVLVLEKNKIVGDKVCAGGLTVKDLEEFKIPKSVQELSFKHINIYFNKELRRLELNKPWIWTCSRRKLGEWLLKEARKQGAKILLNSKVVKINKKSVLLDNKKEFFFKYLIGADGSYSTVRNYLGLKTENVMTAMQYLVPHGRFRELEIFFDIEKFGPTYAWIFPHKEFDSIGTGANSKFIPSNILKGNLDELCKKLKVKLSECEFKAAPINYDYRGVEFGNIFLIGDAAGLASGTTGEGIHPAMVSGREIAQKIIDPKYKLKGIKELLKYKKMEEGALLSYKINKNFTGKLFEFASFLLRGRAARKELIKFLTNK